jgi:hypothetical protein
MFRNDLEGSSVSSSLVVDTVEAALISLLKDGNPSFLIISTLRSFDFSFRIFTFFGDTFFDLFLCV